MKIRTFFAIASTLVLLVTAMGTVPAMAASGAVVQVPLGGTSTISTGEFTPSGDPAQLESPSGDDEVSPDSYNGTIVNRSLSQGVGNSVSVNSGKKAKSNPTFNTGFEGLNHYQQRYA